jgi:arsenite oxidase large subunit
VPDPVTNNYRYKLGRGRLLRLGESALKQGFAGGSLKPPGLI